MKIFKRAFCVVLAGFASFIYIGSCCADFIVYPAPDQRVPEIAPKPLESVMLERPSGNKVNAWYQKASNPSKTTPLIVYFHGNGENLGTMQYSDIFSRMKSLNVHAVYVDYPSYGLSEGSPSDKSLIEAADIYIDWAAKKHPDSSIFLMGFSLGSGVAAQCVEKNGVKGLILANPFESLSSAARDMMPGFIVSMILWDEFDTKKVVTSLNKPLLIVYGTHDHLIRPKNSHELKRVYRGPSLDFVAVNGATHNSLIGRNELWNALQKFIKTHS